MKNLKIKSIKKAKEILTEMGIYDPIKDVTGENNIVVWENCGNKIKMTRDGENEWNSSNTLGGRIVEMNIYEAARELYRNRKSARTCGSL